jgi:hypothetical protein
MPSSIGVGSRVSGRQGPFVDPGPRGPSENGRARRRSRSLVYGSVIGYAGSRWKVKWDDSTIPITDYRANTLTALPEPVQQFTDAQKSIMLENYQPSRAARQEQDSSQVPTAPTETVAVPVPPSMQQVQQSNELATTTNSTSHVAGTSNELSVAGATVNDLTTATETPTREDTTNEAGASFVPNPGTLAAAFVAELGAETTLQNQQEEATSEDDEPSEDSTDADALPEDDVPPMNGGAPAAQEEEEEQEEMLFNPQTVAELVEATAQDESQ